MTVRETRSSHAHKGSPAPYVGAGVRRISSSAMLCEAAERMRRLGVSDLPVVENNEIVGLIADGDIAGPLPRAWT